MRALKWATAVWNHEKSINKQDIHIHTYTLDFNSKQNTKAVKKIIKNKSHRSFSTFKVLSSNNLEKYRDV